MDNIKHTILGRTELPVHRLGLSATYRPGKDVIYKAIDAGINYFFAYGFDTHMTKTLREVFAGKRENYIVATGAYNLLIGHTDFRKTVEKRLRQFKTDYIDVFLFLGVTKPGHFPTALRDELNSLKEEGKIKFTGMSCHDRKFIGELAKKGELDLFMVRYNAAHPGAEEDVFPFLEEHNPAIVSYTATRWRYLLRYPHKGWPKDGRIPTAGECYRFALSNPHVHVCMSAPSNMKHLRENLSALDKGPLNEEDMWFMREFGAVVHHTKKWFI